MHKTLPIQVDLTGVQGDYVAQAVHDCRRGALDLGVPALLDHLVAQPDGKCNKFKVGELTRYGISLDTFNDAWLRQWCREEGKTFVRLFPAEPV